MKNKFYQNYINVLIGIKLSNKYLNVVNNNDNKNISNINV